MLCDFDRDLFVRRWCSHSESTQRSIYRHFGPVVGENSLSLIHVGILISTSNHPYAAIMIMIQYRSLETENSNTPAPSSCYATGNSQHI